MSSALVLPAGMTADKLRYIADWLDLFEQITLNYIEACERSNVGDPGQAEKARESLRSKQVQTDLRQWAAQIDGGARAHG